MEKSHWALSLTGTRLPWALGLYGHSVTRHSVAGHSVARALSRRALSRPTLEQTEPSTIGCCWWTDVGGQIGRRDFLDRWHTHKIGKSWGQKVLNMHISTKEQAKYIEFYNVKYDHWQQHIILLNLRSTELQYQLVITLQHYSILLMPTM